MILAQTTTIMGVEATFLSNLLLGIGLLWTMYRNTNKAKKETVEEIVKEVKRVLAVDENEEQNSRLPQPLTVKQHQDVVYRGSYETHCRLNREEHAAIRREFNETLKGLEKSHHDLACKVSGIATATEINGNTLVAMNRNLADIARTSKS